MLINISICILVRSQNLVQAAFHVVFNDCVDACASGRLASAPLSMASASLCYMQQKHHGNALRNSKGNFD